MGLLRVLNILGMLVLGSFLLYNGLTTGDRCLILSLCSFSLVSVIISFVGE